MSIINDALKKIQKGISPHSSDKTENKPEQQLINTPVAQQPPVIKQPDIIVPSKTVVPPPNLYANPNQLQQVVSKPTDKPKDKFSFRPIVMFILFVALAYFSRGTLKNVYNDLLKIMPNSIQSFLPGGKDKSKDKKKVPQVSPYKTTITPKEKIETLAPQMSTPITSVSSPAVPSPAVPTTPPAQPPAASPVSLIPQVVKKQFEPKSQASQEPFILNGIFFSEDKGGYALVNNQIVKVGDTINGAVVKKITDELVELETEGSIIKLSTRLK
ncbi:MAG: hypothetical protein PHO70_07865 [Candidatus Omnitrophica bacterium]|nr:hypothetical protein [Candidatus Omnitrophota bacterium]